MERMSVSSTNVSPYTPDDWIYRKFVVISKALYSSVIMTIYHLAQSLICFLSESAESRESVYDVLRKDLSEAWSWALLVADDEEAFSRLQETELSKLEEADVSSIPQDAIELPDEEEAPQQDDVSSVTGGDENIDETARKVRFMEKKTGVSNGLEDTDESSGEEVDIEGYKFVMISRDV